jgi:hypothetical protein
LIQTFEDLNLITHLIALFYQKTCDIEKISSGKGKLRGWKCWEVEGLKSFLRNCCGDIEVSCGDTEGDLRETSKIH